MEAAYPAPSLCALPLEEVGGEDHVSCNYIYVGSHSICHSKFCLTCHIVNHYSRLNAGYELKRPESFFLFLLPRWISDKFVSHIICYIKAVSGYSQQILIERGMKEMSSSVLSLKKTLFKRAGSRPKAEECL